MKVRHFSSEAEVIGAAETWLDEKYSEFFFSVQGTVVSPPGSDPENMAGDQDTGSRGRPVSSGLQVPGEPGYCARTRFPWLIFRGIFPSKYPSVAPVEMHNTPR